MMSKKEKRLLKRILLAGAIFVLALPLHFRDGAFALTGFTLFRSPILAYVELPVFLAAYALIGWDVLWSALRNIRHGQVFDENLLMAAATVGAFCLGEYAEGVAVMLFYQVGELFQSYAVSRSRRSIADLMDIRPDYANVLRDGGVVQVDPEEVAVGDTILVRPGERVPLDGTVMEGASTLDTSALTGESAPRDVGPGGAVISGTINLTGLLTIRAEKEYGQSTVAKILELVETAADKKSRSERFITRFARYYTPIVVFAALALALLPPLFTGQPLLLWTKRALIFLVISCPCALVISVPLSFFGGIGGASKSGVLVKGGNFLELLANTEVVVFDKTGTLTKGNFEVTAVSPQGMGEEELLRLAAHAEGYSGHPIAQSIGRAYGKALNAEEISDVEEIAGHGVRARVGGREILAGNGRLMRRHGIAHEPASAIGTVVHVAADGTYAGYIRIADEIKADAPRAISDLRRAGIREIAMLTGDLDQIGRQVGEALQIDRVYTELLPGDKVAQVERLMAERRGKGALVFVGDGINDAPVLSRADVGVAMGGLGSDAAIEAADVVIMTDEPSKLATVIRISKRTLRIARQNIVFALVVKAAVLALGALGLANMWGAVFADVGVSVIAILNAMRALSVKAPRRSGPAGNGQAAVPAEKQVVA